MSGKVLDRFRQEGPKRPRSKAEKEKRRRFLIVLLIVLAVISAAGILGYGYYDLNVKPWHEPIVKVNGTVFEMRYFVDMMRFNGGASGADQSLAEQVATSIEENELMKQELEGTYGISIGEDAVDADLRSLLVSENATEEEFDQQYKSLAAYLKSAYGLSVSDLKKLYIRPSLVQEELKKQMGDALYPVTDNFEHAQVEALLVTGSDNATQLRTRWEAGEAFDTLSTDNSVLRHLSATAADNITAEWVAKGIESTAFDDYTFSDNTTLGVISQPIPDSDDSENYWLIEVLARESRPLSESDRDTLISKALEKWLEDAKASEDNVIVNYLYEKGGTAKLNWALDHVAVSTS